MKKLRTYILLIIGTILLASGEWVARAEVSQTDQQTLKTQYMGKVLVFRKPYRMVTNLEVADDGTVKSGYRPGFWAVDGAVQVKDMDFKKDRVTFKCARLWANVKDDGQLHFFPASAALKGKSDYPENEDINFRTKKDVISAGDISQRVKQVFLGEQESILNSTPQPIAAYIQKIPAQVDVDPVTGMGFAGTPPKAVSRPSPDLPREAQLIGQSGRESFVVFVDEQGNAAVVAFTHLLQYGLEEATIAAVKTWKFQPAMKDGKPVALRIPMSIDFKPPSQK
jgi:hypothetical protein